MPTELTGNGGSGFLTHYPLIICLAHSGGTHIARIVFAEPNMVPAALDLNTALQVAMQRLVDEGWALLDEDARPDRHFQVGINIMPRNAA